MQNMDGKTILFASVGVALLYVVYKATKAAGDAAGKLADAGAGALHAANDATSTTVGAVGAAFGLPTPDETLSDPAQVRWIIDNAGHMAASQWGTALAWLKAEGMQAGTGTPPPAWVQSRLDTSTKQAQGGQGLQDQGGNGLGWALEDQATQYPWDTRREVTSPTSGVIRTSDPTGQTFNSGQVFDPFGLGQYSTGSIYDATSGAGEQVSPGYFGGLGSSGY